MENIDLSNVVELLSDLKTICTSICVYAWGNLAFNLIRHLCRKKGGGNDLV